MENIRKHINELTKKFNSNSSSLYYIIPVIFILGLVFFINSKSIFSDEGAKIRSTNLNEIQTTGSLNAKIISRKYNPITKTMELIIYAEDSNNIEQKELQFELREQKNPNIVIPTRYQKIDNNYYVVLSKVKKDWEVVSLSLGYENEIHTSKDEDIENIDIENIDKTTNKKSLISVVRIYSDSDDIQRSSFLSEKKKNEYISEVLDIEVDFINKDIEKLNAKIDDDNSKIKDAENKILELKNDKKYQTESEKNTTDTNITRLKSLISSARTTGEQNVEKVKELKEKINKLQQKKRDFGI